MRIRIDGLALVSLGLMIVMIASLIIDRTSSAAAPEAGSESHPFVSEAPQPAPLQAVLPIATEAPPEDEQDDPTTFAAPYDNYTVTQGPHGGWYGHMAIDLAAGKDTPIKSPISGIVTDLFVDQWGNPNLVIENDVYRVSLLHGNFSVTVNAPVEIGQIVGNESNLGYTTDMNGNSCVGRNCGYHTHLNVINILKSVNYWMNSSSEPVKNYGQNQR